MATMYAGAASMALGTTFAKTYLKPFLDKHDKHNQGFSDLADTVSKIQKENKKED
jgi:hypothetical protein